MKTLAIASIRKDTAQIGAEWDAIADRRHQQIQSQRDLSFWHVLAPTALELLRSCDTERVLDVGCGTGELTQQIATAAAFVLGIDVSRRSVEIAREQNAPLGNVRFAVGPLEQLLPNVTEEPFSTAVAGMSLMTAPDLTAAMRAVADVLRPGGRLLATITHPCFWPAYWGYDAADWFRYDQEIFVEAPFRISMDRTDRVTTHVHRPLSMYLNEAAQVGLCLDLLQEPMPSKAIDDLYPEPWTGPRFLALRWKKVVDSEQSGT
jgi:SAM-dependent methyltransferase